MLSTLSVALTTGKPGEVFTVAFDKRECFTLVFAKNDTTVTIEDDRAVRDWFSAITSPETKDAHNVLPFPFSRCRQNIEKRVTKMLEATTTFSLDLPTILRGYEPSSSIE